MTGIRQDTKEAYDTFLVTFSTVYDIFFSCDNKNKN